MSDAESILRINALGTLLVNEAFYTIASEGFAIVNVASMAAHLLPRFATPTRQFRKALRDHDVFTNGLLSACSVVPTKWRPALAYSLSKNFVTWYCRTQARGFGDRGARIVSVSPGSIDTAMGRLEESSGAGHMVLHGALNRFGTAEELAHLLVFCASTKAGYLTGTDILCDGGVTSSLTLWDKLAVGRNA